VAAPLTFGFLRAVNVGNRQMKMTELAEALTRAGLCDVTTFIASGNVVFDGGGRDRVVLRTLIEDTIEVAFGFHAEIYLRSATDLRTIAAAVETQRNERDVTINIALMDLAPHAQTEAAFAPFQGELERFVIYDDFVIWLATVKISETPFFYKGMKNKTLPVMTIRNFNTIARMLAKWGSCPADLR
jgi:uncharacterized protein (DUF1697 family)